MHTHRVHPDAESKFGRQAYEPSPGDGQPAGNGAPPPYGSPAPYGSPTPYGPPAYGAPAYGPPAYGPPPGYGYPPPGNAPGWNGQLPGTGPHGPGRPGIATAAAVLGFVTAGLTLLMSIFFLIALDRGGDGTFAILLLGSPCAAGMIVGGVRLLARRTHYVLLSSAVAAVLVLILTFLVGLATESGDANVLSLVLFLVLAGALPITTAALTAQPRVSGWMNALP